MKRSRGDKKILFETKSHLPKDKMCLNITMRFILIGIGCLIVGCQARAATLGASYDADAYHFTGTYNEVRTGALNSGTFHIGQHILDTNPTYNRHFNFGAVFFRDLSSFSLGSSKFLQLNLKDFKTPVSVDPDYQGPPNTYSYLSTGNFRLALVALSADFAETAITEDLAVWYQTNLFSRPRIAVLDVTSAGNLQIDVTSTVDSWISETLTNFGFGLVGLDSTPTASTLRFYSMEDSSGFGPALIPEPSTGTLLLIGLASFLSMRRRFPA